MYTAYVTEQHYADAAIQLAHDIHAINDIYPESFKKKMRENRGIIEDFLPYPKVGDGLERRNPLAVALGDSVTAGHFEGIGDPEEFFKKVACHELSEADACEITDMRQGYVERFRNALIDLYEQTSPTIINSGIAGDTIVGMKNRLFRDVISHQPDLILINGSLNWPPACGSTEEYERVLREMIILLQEETRADIILMTPNMALPSPIPELNNPASDLAERVNVIRTAAQDCKISLADTYLVWEEYEKRGYPVEALLANKLNHPSVTGHEMYKEVLMQFFRSIR